MRHRPRPATVASTALKTYNTAITVAAPAKVNLYLHVTGCRDGFTAVFDPFKIECAAFSGFRVEGEIRVSGNGRM